MKRFAGGLACALLAVALSTAVYADEKPPITSIPLLTTTTTGDGQPLVYPSGTPQIISRITIIQPGAATARHRHPMPLFAYILEGELTIQAEGQPARRFKEGEAFIEVAQWHVGRNDGNKPLKLLAVYAGAVGLPLSNTQ